MSRRSGVLDLAVLGLLQESPMHGYELRKRLNALLGAFRALSYGTLYPCLKDLVARGWIQPSAALAAPGLDGTGSSGGSSARGRIVYELTADGKERLQDLLAEAGPATWEDESFDVRFAFFARTDAAVRLRILEGRRTRLEERLDNVRAAAGRARDRMDGYTLALQQHGLEAAEREVRWLNELIETERRTPTDIGATTSTNSSTSTDRTDSSTK